MPTHRSPQDISDGEIKIPTFMGGILELISRKDALKNVLENGMGAYRSNREKGRGREKERTEERKFFFL